MMAANDEFDPVQFLKGILQKKGTCRLSTLCGHLGQLHETARIALGRDANGLLEFIKARPEHFCTDVAGKKYIISVNQGTSTTSKVFVVPEQPIPSVVNCIPTNVDALIADGVKFLKSVLQEKGHCRIDVLYGHLGRKGPRMLQAMGKNPKLLAEYLLTRPEDFAVTPDGRYFIAGKQTGFEVPPAMSKPPQTPNSDEDVSAAVNFFINALQKSNSVSTLKKLQKLCNQANDDVKRHVGGDQAKVEKFLRQHSDVFVVKAFQRVTLRNVKNVSSQSSVKNSDVGTTQSALEASVTAAPQSISKTSNLATPQTAPDVRTPPSALKVSQKSKKQALDFMIRKLKNRPMLARELRKVLESEAPLLYGAIGGSRKAVERFVASHRKDFYMDERGFILCGERKDSKLQSVVEANQASRNAALQFLIWKVQSGNHPLNAAGLKKMARTEAPSLYHTIGGSTKAFEKFIASHQNIFRVDDKGHVHCIDGSAPRPTAEASLPPGYCPLLPVHHQGAVVHLSKTFGYIKHGTDESDNIYFETHSLFGGEGVTDLRERLFEGDVVTCLFVHSETVSKSKFKALRVWQTELVTEEVRPAVEGLRTPVLFGEAVVAYREGQVGHMRILWHESNKDLYDAGAPELLIFNLSTCTIPQGFDLISGFHAKFLAVRCPGSQENYKLWDLVQVWPWMLSPDIASTLISYEVTATLDKVTSEGGFLTMREVGRAKPFHWETLLMYNTFCDPVEYEVGRHCIVTMLDDARAPNAASGVVIKVAVTELSTPVQHVKDLIDFSSEISEENDDSSECSGQSHVGRQTFDVGNELLDSRCNDIEYDSDSYPRDPWRSRSPLQFRQ